MSQIENNEQNTQERIIPKLRFPEFQTALGWINQPLDKFCEINPTHDGLPDKFVYIDLEAVSSGKLVSKNIVNKKDAPSRAQRLLQNNDVIYQMVRPYQRNNYLCNFNDSNSYVASTGYAQLRKNLLGGFIFQLVHTDSFVNQVLEKCTGSNYPAINTNSLAGIQIAVPPLSEEQQKIANCLSSIDELIELEEQAITGLKQHKKGLMQQLFPVAG